ncbi:MAG: thiamine phosphate synthase [Betaproteobacteria bacterium]|nr:thiamine phosphate synthase [Betaproteobacteria bacterium]
MIGRSSPFGEGGLVLLIDPDRTTGPNATDAIRLASSNGFTGAWIGGTFLHRADGRDITRAAVDAGCQCSLPIFAILGLSAAETTLVPGLSGVLLPLIGTLSAAGELLGQAYRATPALKGLGTPVVPMAYLAVDGGRITSSSHGLQGVPLPRDKPEIAATLALCGELTGARCVYLDAGSGAIECVPAEVIAAVRAAVGVSLVVGGGIRRPEEAERAFSAGADVVVVGSVFEGATSRSKYASFGAIVPRGGNHE